MECQPVAHGSFRDYFRWRSSLANPYMHRILDEDCTKVTFIEMFVQGSYATHMLGSGPPSVRTSPVKCWEFDRKCWDLARKC
jgi:hypothetical protein